MILYRTELRALLLGLALSASSPGASAMIMGLHEQKTVEGWMADLERDPGDHHAIRSVRFYGAKALPAVPLLRKSCRHERPGVRSEAVLAVAWIWKRHHGGTPLEGSEAEWLERLRGKGDRALAAFALERLATEKSLKPLAEALGDEDDLVRYLGAKALCGIIRRVSNAAPKERKARHEHIVSAWKRITDAAMPSLIEMTRDPDRQVARAAIETLGCFSGRENDVCRPAVPALTAALRSPDVLIRYEAAYALDRYGRNAPEAIPHLARALSKYFAHPTPAGWPLSDWAYPGMLLQAFRGHGEAAREAVPLVIMALSHKSPQVRREAAATLADIGSPGQGVEKLAELLADPNYEVRARAAMALGKAGEAAKPHVLKLVPLLEDDKAHVRQWAAWALAGLAAHAGDAAGELRRCLRDEDAEVRRAARYALERIKEKGR